MFAVALAESLRILKELKDINVDLNQIINNKMHLNPVCVEINKAFAGYPMLNFPRSETPLIGIETLNKFLEMNTEAVEEQLNVC